MMDDREISAAMDFLAALGRLDFDAVDGFLDESAVLDLPYAGSGVVVAGRQEISDFLRRSMTGSVTAIDYKLDRAYPSPDAGALVLEVSTQGLAPTGRAYTNRLIAIFEFRNGKIALFREYYNPAALST